MNKIEELYIRTGNARIYKTMTGYQPSFSLMLKKSFKVYGRDIANSIFESNPLFEHLVKNKVQDGIVETVEMYG